MGEKFGRDNIWEGHLASELWAANVDIQAVLDEMDVPLRKMLDLKVGDTIYLNSTPESKVEIKCGDIRLTDGRVGRMGNKVAVRVESPISDRAKASAIGEAK